MSKLHHNVTRGIPSGGLEAWQIGCIIGLLMIAIIGLVVACYCVPRKYTIGTRDEWRRGGLHENGRKRQHRKRDIGGQSEACKQ